MNNLRIPEKLRKLAGAAIVPLLLVIVTNLMWLWLHSLIGGTFWGPSPYNSYTRQAMAWRQGLLHLPGNVPYLELAVFNGEYFVSFPPLPSVVELPLTFIFGMGTPDSLLVKAYVLGACLILYYAFKRAGYNRWAAGGLAFLITFASSMLPMTLQGCVWFHAQTLAFLLTVTAVCCIRAERPSLALFTYALSVACRPLNALYGLPLFFVWISLRRRENIDWRRTLKPLIPGVVLGLIVAMWLGAYNYVRFGNPLEFGHNYLPEFSTEGGVQFSIAHVARNAQKFLLGLPLHLDKSTQSIRLETYGFSMLLACPTLGIMLIWPIVDAVKKRLTREKLVILLTCVLHGFLLLHHRTFGGKQLGARYAVDMIPYTVLYLLVSPEKTKPHWSEWVFLGGTMAFMTFALYLFGL